jgi:predicted nucleotidyltransferase
VTPRSEELRALADEIVAALPASVVEAVVTGSVSRGTADDASDVELLLVTEEQLDLDAAYELARGAGLRHLDSWGPQGTPTLRVFGYREGVPIELIWWSRAHAEEQVAAYGAAEAIANGFALRTSGLHARWQERLAAMPDGIAAQRIEDAALTWGGFAPEGFLTLLRPGDRLALVERLVDDAQRVLAIVYAVNGRWLPTSKRLAARAESLAVRPERLAERIEQALTEIDARQALLTMTELQADTVALAPAGTNVDRARRWLPRVAAVLRAA